MGELGEQRRHGRLLRSAGRRAVLVLAGAAGVALLAVAWFCRAPSEPELGQLVFAKGVVARRSHGLAVSAWDDGSFVVVGELSGQALFGWGEPNAATLLVAEAPYGDQFLARYARDGALMWAKRIGATGRDIVVPVVA